MLGQPWSQLGGPWIQLGGPTSRCPKTVPFEQKKLCFQFENQIHFWGRKFLLGFVNYLILRKENGPDKENHTAEV